MKTMIPQIDLLAAYSEDQADLEAGMLRVAGSGWYVLGREVEAFEQAFAAYLGARSVVGVANGTDAIEIALRACGVGRDDIVVTVSHTAVATIAAIRRCGAIPSFVDVEPVSCTMCPLSLEQALPVLLAKYGERLKAVVPVHLYGHPSDMTKLMPVARAFKLKVVEDCAQAHGATLGMKKVGTFGDAGAFSFYPTKNLGALGDGGAIACGDAEVGSRVTELRQYGWRERYVSHTEGVNSRLDEIQAAILGVRLKRLDRWNARRRVLADFYTAELEGRLHEALPAESPSVTHVYHQYVIRVPDRDALRARLGSRGVGSAIHYPVPVHLQPAYVDWCHAVVPLNETERLARRVLSLPMYPQLTDDAVSRVVEILKESVDVG